MLYPTICMPIYDSNGNIPPSIFDNLKPYEIDTSSSTLTDIPQILYIDDGRLKSYIPWVSPSVIKINTAQTNQFIGYAEYFSTCYNYNFNFKPEKNRENIFLGETSLKLKLDSIDNGSRLKELYGRNMLETLLPYASYNKLDILTLDSKIKLNPEEMSDSILLRVNTVPQTGNIEYTGNNTQNTYPEDYFNIGDFKEVQIVQEWYYNYSENIVFNEIKELYLCAKKWTAKGEDKETSPILKLVFK